MEEATRWFVGFMVFLATFGLVVLFGGVSYLNLDTSKITLFEGFSNNLYDASRQFVLVGGVFMAGLAFVGVAVSIKDFLWELVENF